MVEYDCKFELHKFPFDTQVCHFKFSIPLLKKNPKLRFIQTDSMISYSGPKKVNDFYIQEINVDSGINDPGNVWTNENMWFRYNITMQRYYGDQILTTFVPTWLVWTLAYLTFFLRLKNFNERFMGSITSALVLAALLIATTSSLPKTSYFKYIDCWFLWHHINCIFMIAYHVFLNQSRYFFKKEKLQIHKLNVGSDRSLSLEVGEHKEKDKKRLQIRKRQMNKIAIILFPMMQIIFSICYFELIFLHFTF